MFPSFLKPLSRHFRSRRNRALVALIHEIAAAKGGPIEVLDIGGAIVFWLSIPEAARSQCKVSLLNLPGGYENLPPHEEEMKHAFNLWVGDACDLSRFGDKSFDLVVCNSVIEHVGTWENMEKAAAEAARVGRRGWVQVPAFEFPIEQHYLLPFVHWFAPAIEVKLVGLLRAEFRKASLHDRQMSVHHIRPLTRGEFRHLLPEARHTTEWLLFPKSYIATW